MKRSRRDCWQQPLICSFPEVELLPTYRGTVPKCWSNIDFSLASLTGPTQVQSKKDLLKPQKDKFRRGIYCHFSSQTRMPLRLSQYLLGMAFNCPSPAADDTIFFLTLGIWWRGVQRKYFASENIVCSVTNENNLTYSPVLKVLKSTLS